MSPVRHAALSSIVTVGFFVVTRSWAGSLVCFLSGIFIDIDHFFDFWIAKRKLLFTYIELHAFFADERQGKIYLIFHSYELLAILWSAIYFFHLGPVWSGAAWGMTTHMLADQLVNPLRPWGYFLFSRAKGSFLKKNIFKEEYYQQMV